MIAVKRRFLKRQLNHGGLPVGGRRDCETGQSPAQAQPFLISLEMA